MPTHTAYDAIIVGAGPNGLAAAITLARAGCSVLVLEARETIGGGTRTAELTLPGFRHDICSAIQPLSVISPFFRTLPLADYGVKWIYPPVSLAHPFDDGSAALMDRSLEASAATLGSDAGAYRRLIAPLLADWDKILPEILGPLPFPPRHPLALARFGWHAIRSGRGLAESAFKDERARTMFAGLAGHSIMPLESPTTASYGLVFSLSIHANGWPLPQGGAHTITQAMAAYLQSLGGEIVTSHPVASLSDLPSARALLFAVTPRNFTQILGEKLPAGYRKQLTRFRYGPGVCKVDAALDGPIPWKNPQCAQAGVAHLGGSLDEICASERAVWQGIHPEKPFVLLAQQSLFDPSRAPQGKHTLWAYCHVPNGSTFDMTERIFAQIERFAPGFRQRVLAYKTHTAADMQAYNPNYVGGDINSGAQSWTQLFTRPNLSLNPYVTPVKGVYLCSSSTPPGGGVHGMCGYHAAKAALRRL